jgi:hypothetical protein
MDLFDPTCAVKFVCKFTGHDFQDWGVENV